MSNNLPTVQRFYVEDVKGSPSWFHEFINTLNQYAQPVYNILNQGIDLTANTKEEIYSFTISNASATGSSNALSFTPRKFVGAPSGVVIAQCVLSASVPTAVGNPVTLDWVWTGSQVKILAVYGLTAGKTYAFTVRVF